MKNSHHSFVWRLILTVALVATAGCSTLQYRAVQSRFQDAVRADNERFNMPFTDVAGVYHAVADDLTADYITRLDAKFRPNAWTLRAVSQWRAGELAQAVESAFGGLAEITRLKEQIGRAHV